MTGISKENIGKITNGLIRSNVLISEKSKNSRTLELNKNYTEWKVQRVVKTTTKGWLKQPPLSDDKGGQNNHPTVVKTTTDSGQNNHERVVKTTTIKDKRNSKDNFKETEKLFFDKFWNAYPKKVGKKKAFEKWQKLKPDSQLTDAILKSIETIKIFKWNHTDPVYIPNALTWLNGDRWNDEPVDERSEHRRTKNGTNQQNNPKGFEHGDAIGDDWLTENQAKRERQIN